MATFVTLPRTDNMPAITVNRDAITFVGATSLAATASYLHTDPGSNEYQGQIDMAPAAVATAVGRALVALPLADTGDENETDWQKAGTIYVKPAAVFQLIPVSASITDLYVAGWGRAHIGLSLDNLKAALA
jgi:hypothetical protein